MKSTLDVKYGGTQVSSQKFITTVGARDVVLEKRYRALIQTKNNDGYKFGVLCKEIERLYGFRAIQIAPFTYRLVKKQISNSP